MRDCRILKTHHLKQMTLFWISEKVNPKQKLQCSKLKSKRLGNCNYPKRVLRSTFLYETGINKPPTTTQFGWGFKNMRNPKGFVI